MSLSLSLLTEKKTRDSAIKSLSLFLAKSGEEPIAPLEMAKLWKGIFYCEQCELCSSLGIY